MKAFRNKIGFTLLEVLLVISLIAIVSGIGVPVYQSFQIRNDLSVATNTIAQSLRRAQLLSQAVEGDAMWGVYVSGGSITLFQGADYVTRNISYDEVFDLPTVITPTGLIEIVFDKFTGIPQDAGSLVLTSVNDSTTITINEKGIVGY